MITKFRRWAQWLLHRYPANQRALLIRRELLRDVVPDATGSTRLFAVECVEDAFYLGLFGAICLQLRATTRAVPEMVIGRSVSGAVGTDLRQRFLRSTLVGMLISNQWIRVLRGIVDRVAYRSLAPWHVYDDVRDWFRSRAIWRRASTADDVAAMSVLGVPMGDLIIDSFLRFRPAPRFEPRDSFVRRLIWQAHRDVRRARGYFRRRRPEFYLTSYTTYIDHGVAVRVALQEGIRVWSFGSFLQFAKQLTLADSLHSPDASAYRAGFDRLDEQARRLAEADEQLRLRLAGGIDLATSYMRVSAYASASEPVPDMQGAVVVFLHDFYDSPHVYHDLVFPDFWSWACFTVETLQQSGRRFFLKPHPNQISLSTDALRDLLEKYPGVGLLPVTVNSVRLAEAGMICGVTMYGSVAHELAYLGIPSIACARHPHHSFDFCRTALDVEEYARYLRTPEVLPASREELHRQALAFYYMHNLHGDAAGLSLRRAFIAYWVACANVHTSDAGLLQALRDLKDSAEFKLAVERIR